MVKVEIVCMAAELIYNLNALTSFITCYQFSFVLACIHITLQQLTVLAGIVLNLVLAIDHLLVLDLFLVVLNMGLVIVLLSLSLL